MLLRAGIAAVAALVALTGTAAADPGDVSTQVINGSRASTKDFPFAVFLQRPGAKDSFCGGSIVAPNKILTAGHCADNAKFEADDPARIQVVAGRDDKQTTAGVVAQATKIVVHPEWTKSQGLRFDFAVITLDRRLPFKPIPLAGLHDGSLYKPGNKPTVLGWGDIDNKGTSSRFLLKANLPIQPDRECTETYGPEFYQPSSMMCAGDLTGKQDGCFGDSGGPFVFRGKLVGVVSFGAEECAIPDVPAVYSKVASANTWIKTQTVV